MKRLVLFCTLILIPALLFGASYNATNIKDLDNSTPGEGLSYIPELNDASREIKKALQNSLLSVATKTADYTIQISDSFIICDPVLDNLTMTFPTAASRAGVEYSVKRYDSAATANVCIVATTSSQTIDGSLTYTLSLNKTNIRVKSDGTNWKIVQYPYDSADNATTAVSVHNSDSSAHVSIQNALSDNVTSINDNLTLQANIARWRHAFKGL